MLDKSIFMCFIIFLCCLSLFFKGVKMYKNLTPHDIVIFRGEEKVVIPKSGEVLRLGEAVVDKGLSDEGDLVVGKSFFVESLPPQIEGVNYLISIIMLPYLPQNRGDFLAPDTGNDSCVRDNEGKIVGVRRFISHQQ